MSPEDVASVARWSLENANDYPGMMRRYNTVEFRVWHNVSFGNDRSWTVLTHRSAISKRPDHSVVRRVTWTKAREGEPLLEALDAPLPAATLIRLWTDLRQISLPPFIEPEAVGLDGASFGIESCCFRKVTLSWWLRAPSAWKDLSDWMTEAIGSFESFLYKVDKDHRADS